MKTLIPSILLTALLTACGGGGSATPEIVATETAQADAPAADGTTPATVSKAEPSCKPVDIFLFGDSTQEIAYSWAILDHVNQVCPGSTITNFGMGGQDSRQALAGLLPLNTVTYDQPGASVPTFAQNIAGLPNNGRKRIVVTNWGINSFWHGVTDPSVVLNDVIQIHAIVAGAGMAHIVETPNPIFGGYINEVAQLAAMERGLGYPLIDQFATCAAMDCQSNMQIQNGVLDFVHPGPAVLVAKAAASAAVIIQQAR